MTLYKVILDIGDKEFASGLTYTGTTRTNEQSNLAFSPFPSFYRIKMIFFTKAFKERVKEEKRKEELSKTPTPTPPSIGHSDSDRLRSTDGDELMLEDIPDM